MGVHKSEKQAWGGAGGSGVAAGRVSDSVATARALALAQAQALVPQRRVGVAIVMMWDAAEGKGAFRCGLLLRLPHWLPAAGSLALSSLPLPRFTPPSRQRLRGAGKGTGGGQQPSQTTSGGNVWDEAAGFTVRLVGLIRFRVSGVE